MNQPALRWCGLLLAVLVAAGCGSGPLSSDSAASGGAGLAGADSATAYEPSAADSGADDGEDGKRSAVPDAPDAFRGLGKLAFTREGRLYILDGDRGLQEVAGARPEGSVSWSGDGRWLAYRDGERLMVVEAATGQVQELTGLPGPAGDYAWAPAGSAMAVSVAAAGPAGAAQGGTAPAGQPAARPGEIWLVADPARPEPRRLASLETPAGGLEWSPDGKQLAFVTTLPWESVEHRSDALWVLAVESGAVNRWYLAESAGIDLAGWWPDSGGILFWLRPMHCNSCAADGLRLRSMAAGAADPVSLPVTLLHRSWLSWGPDRRELLLVQGGGRPVWDEKGLEICNVATGDCRDLPQPADAVSLDPAWAPDGSQIALVRAQRRPEKVGFESEARVREWVESRTLWLGSPDGKGFREVPAAGRGIYNPAWAADGQHLLFVRDGGIWVLDLKQQTTRRVATLGDPESLFGFYGQINWAARTAWYQGRR